MTSSDDDAFVAAARASVTIERVHFNHAGTSVADRSVVERMHRQLELEATIGGYEAMGAVADELAAAPAVLAPLFGAGVTAEEILPCEGATQAWVTALWSMAETFGWSAGDRIVVDRFSYATMHTSLAALHATRGVAVEVVGSLPDGSIDPSALADALPGPGAPARLVLVTHVPTHLGTIADTAGVRAVLDAFDARGPDERPAYVLDVSQTLGQLPLDVDALGCDVAFAPGRKFLRAPRGTGVLYVRRALADRLVPLTPPAGVADPTGALDLPAGVRRFDVFEHVLAARLGLAVAAQVALDAGADRIDRLVAARSREVRELLDATPGVSRTGGPDDRAILSFVHDRLDPAAVVAHATAQGVNLWVNPAAGAPLDGAARPVLPSVRVSPHYLTDASDLTRLAKVLDTLPR